MQLNPAIQNPKAVTGTAADLRKLNKSVIYDKLLAMGYTAQQLESFTRWEMVALLREKSSQDVSEGNNQNTMYARGVRFTSKKQREMYQNRVNNIFLKQIRYLSSEKLLKLPNDSDHETICRKLNLKDKGDKRKDYHQGPQKFMVDILDIDLQKRNI